MGSLQIKTQTTTTITHTPQPPTKQPEKTLEQSQAKSESSLGRDIVQKSTTTGTGVIKNVVGGLLVGSTLSGISASALKSMTTDHLHKPTGTSIGLGAALGAGIGLLQVETGSKVGNAITKTAAGALVGGSLTGMTQSTVASMVTERLQSTSVKGVMLGAAVGTGVSLLNSDLGDKDVNNLKNTIAGALIGGGITGIAGSAVTSLMTERLTGVAPLTIALGAALGAGVAILNAEE